MPSVWAKVEARAAGGGKSPSEGQLIRGASVPSNIGATVALIRNLAANCYTPKSAEDGACAEVAHLILPALLAKNESYRVPGSAEEERRLFCAQLRGLLRPMSRLDLSRQTWLKDLKALESRMGGAVKLEDVAVELDPSLQLVRYPSFRIFVEAQFLYKAVQHFQSEVARHATSSPLGAQGPECFQATGQIFQIFSIALECVAFHVLNVGLEEVQKVTEVKKEAKPGPKKEIKVELKKEIKVELKKEVKVELEKEGKPVPSPSAATSSASGTGPSKAVTSSVWAKLEALAKADPAAVPKCECGLGNHWAWSMDPARDGRINGGSSQLGENDAKMARVLASSIFKGTTTESKAAAQIVDQVFPALLAKNVSYRIPGSEEEERGRLLSDLADLVRPIRHRRFHHDQWLDGLRSLNGQTVQSVEKLVYHFDPHLQLIRYRSFRLFVETHFLHSVFLIFKDQLSRLAFSFGGTETQFSLEMFGVFVLAIECVAYHALEMGLDEEEAGAKPEPTPPMAVLSESGPGPSGSDQGALSSVWAKLEGLAEGNPAAVPKCPCGDGTIDGWTLDPAKEERIIGITDPQGMTSLEGFLADLTKGFSVGDGSLEDAVTQAQYAVFPLLLAKNASYRIPHSAEEERGRFRADLRDLIRPIIHLDIRRLASCKDWKIYEEVFKNLVLHWDPRLQLIRYPSFRCFVEAMYILKRMQAAVARIQIRCLSGERDCQEVQDLRLKIFTLFGMSVKCVAGYAVEMGLLEEKGPTPEPRPALSTLAKSSSAGTGPSVPKEGPSEEQGPALTKTQRKHLKERAKKLAARQAKEAAQEVGGSSRSDYLPKMPAPKPPSVAPKKKGGAFKSEGEAPEPRPSRLRLGRPAPWATVESGREEREEPPEAQLCPQPDRKASPTEEAADHKSRPSRKESPKSPAEELPKKPEAVAQPESPTKKAEVEAVDEVETESEAESPVSSAAPVPRARRTVPSVPVVEVVAPSDDYALLARNLRRIAALLRTRRPR